MTHVRSWVPCVFFWQQTCFFSHQPETRPVLGAHGLQLGIGLPSPAKDFKDLATWRSWDGIWSVGSVFRFHVRMQLGFPKATCSPNKAAKHACFSDLIGLILCWYQEMVLSSGYKPSQTAWNLRDSMRQLKIQTYTTCFILYECIIYRLLYHCFLPMFSYLSIASIALCTMDVWVTLFLFLNSRTT